MGLKGRRNPYHCYVGRLYIDTSKLVLLTDYNGDADDVDRSLSAIDFNQDRRFNFYFFPNLIVFKIC